MSPAFLFTVITPFDTVQPAGPPPRADFHSSRLRPSNSWMASDGASPHLAAGVTIFGTGDHTSVSSGLVGFCALAQMGMTSASAQSSGRFMIDAVVRERVLSASKPEEVRRRSTPAQCTPAARMADPRPTSPPRFRHPRHPYRTPDRRAQHELLQGRRDARAATHPRMAR